MNYATAEGGTLDALATKVRAFTHGQLAAAPWFRGAQSPASAVTRCMNALGSRRLVSCEVRLIEPIIALPAPVSTWSPGEPEPDFGAIAWRLQSRWPNAPAVPTTLYFATRVANRLFGGPPQCKRIRTDHELHDLSLGSVYLHYLEHNPGIAARWVGEDLLPASGFRLCDVDAIVQATDHNPELVIEFGGRYDARRVQHFHRDCATRRRAYELW